MPKSVAPKLVIRPMRRKDAEAMTKLMRGLQAFHGDKSKTTPDHFIDHCFGPARLADGWIAYAGNIPAGFAVTHDWMNFVRAKPTRTMNLLYVAEKFRAHGIGSALIGFIARDGWKKGIRRMDTSASTYNIKANEFYGNLGFEPTGHHSQKYAADGPHLLKLTKK